MVGNTAVCYLDLESVLPAQYDYVYNYQLHEQVGYGQKTNPGDKNGYGFASQACHRSAYIEDDVDIGRSVTSSDLQSQVSYSNKTSQILADHFSGSDIGGQMRVTEVGRLGGIVGGDRIEMACRHLEHIVEMQAMMHAAPATKTHKHDLLGHLSPSDVLFVKCNECGITYGNHRRFRRHFIEHHGNQEPHRGHVTVYTISASRAANAIGGPHAAASLAYDLGCRLQATALSRDISHDLQRGDVSDMMRVFGGDGEQTTRVVKAKLFNMIPLVSEVMKTDDYSFDQ